MGIKKVYNNQYNVEKEQSSFFNDEEKLQWCMRKYDEYVYYLDGADGFMAIYMQQHLTKCTLNLNYSLLCVIILHKAVKIKPYVYLLIFN